MDPVERAPKADVTVLKERLAAEGAEDDHVLLRRAQELLGHVDPQGTRAGKYTVTVTGGKGVVVGDHTTVFQVFANSPPALASFIRQAQFRLVVDKRARTFVGVRAWWP